MNYPYKIKCKKDHPVILIEDKNHGAVNLSRMYLRPGDEVTVVLDQVPAFKMCEMEIDGEIKRFQLQNNHVWEKFDFIKED